FGLSIIWTEAKKRNISLQQVVQWMATAPAQFAGLGHRKGKIALGFDADFAVFDEGAEYVISEEMIKYRHKITPYAGRKVSGVVERTYVRGHEVYRFGEMCEEAVGEVILRDSI
ncbi:MAG: amidohydrolase family protein, partial [Spongiibacteraceae bacterium]|nr:amidohydrolase family protein [Spongiibacteraceae bacterium]